MSDWVNFHDIRTRIPIERVLFEYYKLDNLKRQGTTATGPCPVHGGDNPRAFHIDFTKNLWHCFTGCKRGGNQLDLVAAKDAVPVREAALRLKRFFLDDGEPETAAPPPVRPPSKPTMHEVVVAPAKPTKKEAPVNPPLTLSLQLLPDHPHILEDRKLQLATAEHFGIGYCARGILAGCIGFPVRDENGALVAYAGRRLKWSEVNDLGKYRFPKGFHKDRVLYNLDRILVEHPRQAVVVVEGFFSVLKLFEAGIPAVALMGSDISAHQAELLRTVPHAILMFDGDEAGRAGSEAAELRLLGKVPFTAVELPNGWEPESVPAELLRWLVDGAVRHCLTAISFEAWLPSRTKEVAAIPEPLAA